MWKTVPGGLVPDEDQGYFIGAAIMPDGASLARTDKMVQQVESIMQKNKDIDTTFALVGLDFLGGGGLKSSSATMFFPLKPWEERSKSAQQLVSESYMQTGRIKEGLPLFFAPPAIQGLGQTGGFEFYMQNAGEGGVKRIAQTDAGIPGRSEQAAGAGGCKNPVARIRHNCMWTWIMKKRVPWVWLCRMCITRWQQHWAATM
jgi:HAE1 family hydrophobic/amphiphilic exporter-1/multidrug efflux pump